MQGSECRDDAGLPRFACFLRIQPYEVFVYVLCNYVVVLALIAALVATVRYPQTRTDT